MQDSNTFFGETKTGKTKGAKAKRETKTTKRRATNETATVRAKRGNDSIKVAIPRNPRAAYELGLMMARFQ